MAGFEEGNECGRDGCTGVISFQPIENCSCHISPPCHACTSVKLHCAMCGWEAEEERFNDHILTVDPKTRVTQSSRLRDLNPAKIDFHSKPHSNSSMIKEGVYPEGTTQEQVLKVVRGTFGGRFERFWDGKFKYIAYTD